MCISIPKCNCSFDSMQAHVHDHYHNKQYAKYNSPNTEQKLSTFKLQLTPNLLISNIAYSQGHNS